MCFWIIYFVKNLITRGKSKKQTHVTSLFKNHHLSSLSFDSVHFSCLICLPQPLPSTTCSFIYAIILISLWYCLLTFFYLIFFLALCLSKSYLPIEYKGKAICYFQAKNVNKYIYVLFSQLETPTIFSLTKNISKKQ